MTKEHGIIQVQTTIQILRKMEKNCVNYSVLKFILCEKKSRLDFSVPD